MSAIQEAENGPQHKALKCGCDVRWSEYKENKAAHWQALLKPRNVENVNLLAPRRNFSLWVTTVKAKGLQAVKIDTASRKNRREVIKDLVIPVNPNVRVR